MDNRAKITNKHGESAHLGDYIRVRSIRGVLEEPRRVLAMNTDTGVLVVKSDGHSGLETVYPDRWRHETNTVKGKTP